MTVYTNGTGGVMCGRNVLQRDDWRAVRWQDDLMNNCFNGMA